MIRIRTESGVEDRGFELDRILDSRTRLASQCALCLFDEIDDGLIVHL